MHGATPEVRSVARRLLALEAATEKPAADSGSAAFRVNEKLRHRLTTLAGTAGFRSLLARALALAGDEVRWLKALHVASDGALEGIEATRAQLSADDIAEGEAVLVARLLGLLAIFIGEGLTMRLVREVWPEIAADDATYDTEADHG